MKKRNKKIIKRILRWLLGTVIVVLCLLAAFALYLTTTSGENLIRSIAETQLSRALQQNVSIEKVETNLISRLQIRKLNISKEQDGSEIAFVKLNELRAHYSLWQLIRQNIHIPALQVDSLQVWVLKDSSGFYNLPLPAPPADPSTADEESTLNIALGTLTMEHCTFHYQDQTVPMSGTLRSFNFHLKNQNLNHYDFAISAFGNDFNYENRVVPVDTIEMKGEWVEQELRIHSSLMTLPGYRLSGDASLDLKADSPEVRGNLQLRGSPQALSEIFQDYLPEQVYPLKGEMNLSIELSGTVDMPRIAALIYFPRLHLAETILREGTIEAEWYDRTIGLKQFTMQIMEGEVQGAGGFEMGEALSHSLDFQVNNLDLARIWSALYHEPSPYQGRINGNISSSGPVETVDSLRLLADLSVQSFRFRGTPLSDFVVQAKMEQGRAMLDLHQADSRILANVRFRDEQLQGDFSVKIHRLEPLAGLFNLMGLRGRVYVKGDLSGTTESPQVRADFGAAGIRYQNLPLDTLQGSLSYSDDQLQFGKSVFSGSLAEIDSVSPPFDFADLAGGFSYQGEFEGSRDNLTGSFSLLFTNPRYAGYEMDSLSVQLSASNNTIYLDRLHAARDSLSILAAGKYSLLQSNGELRLGFFEDGIPATLRDRDYQIRTTFDLSDSARWKMDLVVENLELAELISLAPDMDDISGRLNLDLNFAGTPRKPRADLAFCIHTPRFQQVNMDSIAGRMALKSDFLHLQKLEIAAGENRSWFEGRVQLRKPGEAEYGFTRDNFIAFSAEGDDIDLRLFNPFLTSGMRIAGVSSYRLDMEGSLNNPQINGELSITRGEVYAAEGSPPISLLEMDLSLEDSLLHIRQFSGEIQKTPFNLRGTVIAQKSLSFATDVQLSIQNTTVLRSVGAIDENEMDFSLTVNQFDISFLQPFLTGIENLKGAANSNIKIKGSFTEPDFSGHFSIRDLSFQPEELNAPLSGGVVKINFAGNRVDLDSLYLRLNEGSIESRGYVEIENQEIARLNFGARIQNVKLDEPGEYLLTVNTAQLSYQKQNNQYLLSGDIVLGESKLLYNFRPQAILPFSKKVEQPAAEPTPMMKQTRLSVRVRESDRLWVDNNLARIRLRSELEFIGNLAQPNIAGRVSVEEGYVLYLDRKFQLETGVIDFVDPNRLNPIVDLDARTSVTAYERLESTIYDITLKITGPLDEAKVELFSDPALERSDIVALLTVGATRRQLTGGDGGEVSTAEILEQRIQTLSSRIISGYAGRRLEKLFGLEEVTIQGNLFGGAGNGPQLVASKRITSSAKITYTTTVGHLNEQGIRLDYSLSKHFSLEGQTDQLGESSLGIKYNLRFK